MDPPKKVFVASFLVGLIFLVARFSPPALGHDLSHDASFVLEFVGALAWALALSTLMAMGAIKLLERLSGEDDE